jgi:fermentation-respiration switch protein FrsA (DUF1100 family)
MNTKYRFIAKLLGIVILCFIVGSWVVADFLIGPMPSKVSWPIGLSYSPENVAFSATDGVKLRGWFLPQSNSTKVVVLLHGVRANRESMLPRAEWLHSLGYNVFLYDARGCGESEKVVRSFGFYETRDLLGALLWLQERRMTQVACIGSSQGAATVLLASGQLPAYVSAVVAEAPYATLRATTDDHFRQHTGLPSDYFGMLVVPIAEYKLGFKMDDVSPLHEISKLKAPLFLIGGTSDILAPVVGIQELYVADSGKKTSWLIEHAGHADFFSYAEDQYKQRVGDFLGKYLWP